MRSAEQLMVLTEIRTHHYSLDWRFLLPLSGEDKLLVISEEDEDFTWTLERAGISALNLEQDYASIINGPPDASGDFYALAFPFGLPVRLVDAGQQNQIDSFRLARQWIRPGGYLLVGFEGVRVFHPRPRSRYHCSTPRRMSVQLRRAGYASIDIFGAFPNLRIPEYIFELQPETLDFVFRHRFRHRAFIRNLLRWSSRIIGSAGISSIWPCYFAVAMV